MKNKKETRGGTRQGSGAKPKYNEEPKRKRSIMKDTLLESMNYPTSIFVRVPIVPNQMERMRMLKEKLLKLIPNTDVVVVEIPHNLEVEVFCSNYLTIFHMSVLAAAVEEFVGR